MMRILHVANMGTANLALKLFPGAVIAGQGVQNGAPVIRVDIEPHVRQLEAAGIAAMVRARMFELGIWR